MKIEIATGGIDNQEISEIRHWKHTNQTDQKALLTEFVYMVYIFGKINTTNYAKMSNQTNE